MWFPAKHYQAGKTESLTRSRGPNPHTPHGIVGRALVFKGGSRDGGEGQVG